jgi:hypothetical protein
MLLQHLLTTSQQQMHMSASLYLACPQAASGTRWDVLKLGQDDVNREWVLALLANTPITSIEPKKLLQAIECCTLVCVVLEQQLAVFRQQPLKARTKTVPCMHAQQWLLFSEGVPS